jgi:hypothetical protein
MVALRRLLDDPRRRDDAVLPGLHSDVRREVVSHAGLAGSGSADPEIEPVAAAEVAPVDLESQRAASIRAAERRRRLREVPLAVDAAAEEVAPREYVQCVFGAERAPCTAGRGPAVGVDENGDEVASDWLDVPLATCPS